LIEGRILLFGNDPKIARGLKKTLEKRAFTLYQVKGKVSVKEKILGIEPELIILNYASYPEDNFKVCEQIKRDKSLRNIPVVIISNVSRG